MATKYLIITRYCNKPFLYPCIPQSRNTDKSAECLFVMVLGIYRGAKNPIPFIYKSWNITALRADLSNITREYVKQQLENLLSRRKFLVFTAKMCEWQCCELLQDAATYQPDTLDLNKNRLAAAYWFPCFRELSTKFAARAAESHMGQDDAVERAEKFRHAYLDKLEEYQAKIASNAAGDTVLGTRELLELNETQLRRFGFADPWRKQKEVENAIAVKLLKARLDDIDNIESGNNRWLELVKGVLAGNMFDWGAQAIVNILENDENFGLQAAMERIQKRPWLMDNLDDWLQRLEGPPYKCAVIFVDNSGVDIVLGIIPFARELLKRRTKVLLCANTEPALNDVTSNELKNLLETCKDQCPILAEALASQNLIVYGNGQRGPCLDMRKLPTDLCEAIKANETDLLVIEGMGRALHTNLYAKFSCETLKLAVIKNKWLAEYLGGETFAVMCKYEKS